MNKIILSICCYLIFVSAAICAKPVTLTLDDCLDIALRQNHAIKKAKMEIWKTQGAVTESRSKMIPHLGLTGQTASADDNSPTPTPNNPGLGPLQTSPWAIKAEASQLLFAGGRAYSSYKNARYINEAASAAYHSIVADTLLEVRRTFYLILLNTELVNVREQSVKLLAQQLEEEKSRLKAGTVTEFNVLRADVELANARPHLIRAQNALRLARETLVKLLAIEEPGSRSDFTAINFSGTLEPKEAKWAMDAALRTALKMRPEVAQTAKTLLGAREAVAAARSEYSPEVSLFGNYGIANYTIVGTEADTELKSWSAGIRASWSIFDGMLTHGTLTKAKAGMLQAELTASETKRGVELEVRKAYSDYLQAMELMEAQRKTVDQAEESLRMAKANNQAGTGTLLDVLNAQTSLTEARSNSAEAFYEYNVAIAELERATGTTILPAKEI